MKRVEFYPVKRAVAAWLMVFMLALCLHSCDPRSERRPLIGGIRSESVANPLAPKQSSVSPNTDNAAAEYVEGVEIPRSAAGSDETILRRSGYVVSYNKTLKVPNWVAWSITADRLGGAAKRPRKAFHEDNDVPEPRATDADYYNSGYDRGHMCPAADNTWSEEAMYDSFLFTNICPQNHGLNGGDWNELEQRCRQWAKRYGAVYVVCGPIYRTAKHKTIGRNKVAVPEAFYKVVLRLGDNPAAIGFICDNKGGNNPLESYATTVDEVENITGIDFFAALPDSLESVVEAMSDLSVW